MNVTDRLLSELQQRLQDALAISNLKLQSEYYGMIARKAAIALAVDPMSVEQRDALTALLAQACRGRDEAPLQLPPVLETAEAT